MGTQPAMEVTARVWAWEGEAQGARDRDAHPGRQTKMSLAGWTIVTVLFPVHFPLSSGRSREEAVTVPHTHGNGVLQVHAGLVMQL